MSGSILAHVREQARVCADLGSPLYSVLLARVADDLEQGGPSAEVFDGWVGEPGPAALALRLMGGVHRLVLDRRAPELAYFFPSVGGTGAHEDAWPALRAVLGGQVGELRVSLGQVPQTNEVGRAVALLGGLGRVVAEHRKPLCLVEIGASAGLNLWADEVHPDLVEPGVLIVDRFGCDLAPVDPRTTAGRVRLTSYVWADQVERLERLRAALAVAAGRPFPVRRMGAVELLRGLELQVGVTTVLWHSVMWQYLDPGEQDAVRGRIDELGGQTTGDTGFAHLRLEPGRPSAGAERVFAVTLRTWPGGVERLLGTAAPHGGPVTWV